METILTHLRMWPFGSARISLLVCVNRPSPKMSYTSCFHCEQKCHRHSISLSILALFPMLVRRSLWERIEKSWKQGKKNSKHPLSPPSPFHSSPKRLNLFFKRNGEKCVVVGSPAPNPHLVDTYLMVIPVEKNPIPYMSLLYYNIVLLRHSTSILA